MPDPQAAHTAFYRHTHGCAQCEAVRQDIYRWSHRPNFTRWFAACCPEGRPLLSAWKAAAEAAMYEARLEAAPIDMGGIG